MTFLVGVLKSASSIKMRIAETKLLGLYNMSSPAPVPTPFQVALERYQNALNYLDTSHNKSLKIPAFRLSHNFSLLKGPDKVSLTKPALILAANAR